MRKASCLIVNLITQSRDLIRVLVQFIALALALERYNSITASTPELLISGSDDHTLFLWSVFGGATNPPKPSARLTGHQRQVSHVGFSPDGRWAASAGFDNCLRVWDGRTGK